MSAAEMFPKDQVIVGYKNKILVGLDNSPIQVLEMMGEELIKYADKIIAGDEAFFLGLDIECDDESKETINMLRRTWPQLEEKQRKRYKDQVKFILYCYIDYDEINKSNQRHR